MDRFLWQDDTLYDYETKLCQQSGVSLYDGDNKTPYVAGCAILTSHRLLWREGNSCFGFPLANCVFIEESPSSFSRSAKVIIHLQQRESGQPAGPVAYSQYNFIKLSFKQGGQVEFMRNLNEACNRKQWLLTGVQNKGSRVAARSGIVGFERQIAKRQQETDSNINQAFEDMDKLMRKARDMVATARAVSEKIRNKQGDISEDETIQFKSYLLSMGIDDPVTRETHGSGSAYFSNLARQICDVMLPAVAEAGGMLTLTDVYCRINRARGIELLSPDDLYNACYLMKSLSLPLQLRLFDSGVAVLQAASCDEKLVAEQSLETVTNRESLSADEFAREVSLSVVLARERLLTAESLGLLCRDDSVQGLRFYPNWFRTRTEAS